MGEWKETEIGEIPKDWEIASLGEVGDVTKLAGFEYTDYFNYTDEGEIIALRALNVRDGVLDLTDVKKIKKEVSDNLVRSKLFKDDILFTYVGANIGQFALVPENNKYHLAPNICRIRISDRSLPYFVYSYFRTKPFKENLENFSVGSSQPTMPMGNIRQIKIPVPPIKEQHSIASILSSLDDKIDLLHRQNKTLEALAETLFRQWFVEEDDESWERQPLKDFCEIINGYAFKSEDYRTDGRVIVRTMNFKNGYIDLNDVIYISIEEEPKYQKFQLRRFDFLLVMVGASLGKYSIVTTDILPALQNQNMWNFRVKKNFSQHYLNFAIRKIITDNIGSASGSAREFFQKGQFYEFFLSIPDTQKLNSFDKITEEYFSKIELNRFQIRTLTQLRDTLLPKLMSGEVRVK